jgi:hypothetical protein
MRKKQMQQLKDIEVQRMAAPDQQISLTDPDARSMASSGRGSGMVGYNVQTAVDAKHHLIVAHELPNVGHERNRLGHDGQASERCHGTAKDLSVVADRGYFKGEVREMALPQVSSAFG